jgi:hypothetical protein
MRGPSNVKMIRTPLFVGIVAASPLFMAGCNIGNAPTGPNNEQVQKIENSLPVDQQIKLIESSPMPAAEKAKRIAALKGQPAPANPKVTGNPAVNP